MSEGYNGWSNYETWAMALWIDNEEWSYNKALEIVRLNREEDRIYPVADALKDWQEEMMPDLPASIWSDLLRAAFSDVNWFEIADHYLDDTVDA